MSKKISLHDDISSIRQMMEKSTRFLSLSGLSGVLAGLIGLVGCAIAYYWMYYPAMPWGAPAAEVHTLIKPLVLLGLAVLAAALLTVGGFTYQKAGKQGEKIWNSSFKRLVLNLAIPLAAGGFFILACLIQGYWGLIAPASLAFYGLSLINGAHFTLGDVRQLGYTQLALGVLCAFFPSYGLLFWAIGFGLMHVVYGSIMHFRYDR
ncbi:hypothetical protein QWY31_06040 [Cytophagales bacterium LB-30]|uniref:Uncharacterized protein n=1 Tax=Shiella aurantiaca TaxID=3058365 RepID=A0ABT8F486_9BACT|nr:hypothetical protein [Shiella aurantiaca]MDN4165054.1 hypothetical protein [Shiella aurantiaca]